MLAQLGTEIDGLSRCWRYLHFAGLAQLAPSSVTMGGWRTDGLERWTTRWHNYRVIGLFFFLSFFSRRRHTNEGGGAKQEAAPLVVSRWWLVVAEIGKKSRKNNVILSSLAHYIRSTANTYTITVFLPQACFPQETLSCLLKVWRFSSVQCQPKLNFV